MSKARKKALLVLCIAVFLSSAVFGVLRIRINIEREAERVAERRIMETYERVNLLQYAPFNSGTSFVDLQYRPFRTISPERNRFGICVSTYLFLKFYERETGNTISYEALMDYFSQEFEPDGSLRLYNNGNHPEIQALVEWRWGFGASWREFGIYFDRIMDVYGDYCRTHEEAGFIFDSRWGTLSPKMLDSLARAEADPDYVLDLTSLQQAGY